VRGFGLAPCRLSQCTLLERIEPAKKPGPIPLGQRRGSAAIRSRLQKVPRYLATDECVTGYFPASTVCR
jgi:hypothetical protein